MLCLACTCSMGKKSLSRGVPHIVENLALIHCDRDILWEFLPIYILPLLILLICYILSYFQFSCYPGFYILIWWPCKQNWNSSFRFVCQYWSNIWVFTLFIGICGVNTFGSAIVQPGVLYVYGRGGCLSNYEVGSASGCQVRRERMCVTCISVLVCFWMHSVQKWTRIGSIKCTRSTGPSSALYKTPADMFGPELLLSSLQPPVSSTVFPEKPCVILFAS